MPRRAIGAVVVALFALLCMAAAAQASSGINVYRFTAKPKTIKTLAYAGFDMSEARRINGKVEVYGTAAQMRRLARKDELRGRLVRDRKGRTATQRSVLMVRRGLAKAGARTLKSHGNPTAGASDAGYKVWRKYDAVPNDGREQYTEMYDRIASRYPNITEKIVIGQTEWHRDIVAMQVTRDATGKNIPGRPAVLYNALQHAREWLAGETCKRTLDFFVTQYGKDPQVTRLVNERQLWFVCVSNPDGYEFTFTEGNRLWRKNLREQNGTPGIQTGDGVDPNRNFPVNWGLDNEGSSPDPSSETYRGTGPASELETQAMQNLWSKVPFKFQKNDHTAAELLLYPQGWQQYTPTADDPIYTALAGDDAEPAIETFDPDLGAELYITNGDTLDTAYNDLGILAYTPEGSEPQDKTVSGFEFEDSEGAIAKEFQRHRAFSLDLAESADDPSNPDTHLGNTVQNFYVDAFPLSYGGAQTVQVLAKRSLGPVTMYYRIGNGAAVPVATTEWSDGERYYQEAGVYYHRMRGVVPDAAAGANVTVWFQAAKAKSEAFTYTVHDDTNANVLLMAAEDYTGPTPTTSKEFLGKYEASLTAAGASFDVYDVDAMGRNAPHPLGVLSHYDAVIWYTGNDYLTREPGQVPGTGTSRLALEEVKAIRDYINEGGKVLLAGEHAGQQYFEGYEFRNEGFLQPDEDKQHGKWCDSLRDESVDGCIAHTDDFFQYYLGAYLRVENGGSWSGTVVPNQVTPGDVNNVVGTPPFVGTFETADAVNSDPGAGAPTSTLASTSSLLDTDAYDDFSEVVATWQRDVSGPFSPYLGSQYLHSGTADEAYMRLARDGVTVPSTGDQTLTFQASFDLEQDWDYVFVEVKGADGNWTTLPDANGHTAQGTGQSCWDGTGWGEDLHSRLLNYQTKKGDSCTPVGTTGEWWAATGSSGGWQPWTIDLSGYAGQTIDIAIVYATDWAFQSLGVWIDELSLFGETPEGFEGTSYANWTPGTLAGSPNPATWPTSGTTQSFEEGAVIGTKDLRFVNGRQFLTGTQRDTLYAGFEPGNLTDASRTAFLTEALEYFGVLAEND